MVAVCASDYVHFSEGNPLQHTATHCHTLCMERRGASFDLKTETTRTNNRVRAN